MSPPRQPEWIDTASTAEREILDLRSVGMPHALALGRFHYHQARPMAVPGIEQQHRHWMVLVFALAGTQHYRVDGCETVIHGGELLRVLPGQRYGTGTWPEEKGRLAWLILKLHPAARGPALGMTAAAARAVSAILADPDRPRLLPLPAHAADLVDSVFASWDRRGDELGREVIRNRVAALVLAVADATSGATVTGRDHANAQRIERVLASIDAHCDVPTTTESLARLAGLSTARFHVHFKRVTGCSPKDYVLRKRVERAAERLRARPELTVTAVGHDLGFSSSQHFATVFRRYFGMSPTTYRGMGGE